jgi:hypothetical protein
MSEFGARVEWCCLNAPNDARFVLDRRKSCVGRVAVETGRAQTRRDCDGLRAMRAVLRIGVVIRLLGGCCGGGRRRRRLRQIVISEKRKICYAAFNCRPSRFALGGVRPRTGFASFFAGKALISRDGV